MFKYLLTPQAVMHSEVSWPRGHSPLTLTLRGAVTFLVMTPGDLSLMASRMQCFSLGNFFNSSGVNSTSEVAMKNK